MKTSNEALRRKPQTMRSRTRQRCIGCGALYPTTNVMSSTVGLCVQCSYRSPYGWRTVYDREQRIGDIPANLAPAR